MASTYSDLKIELIGTGEQVGTWGSTTNTNLGTALEEAITGSATVTFSSADVTLTLTNTNGTQTARHLRLVCSGTSGGARQLILGSGCQISKLYLIQNDLADTVTVKNTAGTGVAVTAGAKRFVFNDGTNVSAATTDAIVNLATSVTGTLPVANGGTGAATLTANNVLLGNGTSTLQAVAPSTSGNVLTSNGTTWTSAQGFVTGMIMLWSGSIASIPSGWALCDGSSGRPDLRDRFVVGAGSNYAVNASNSLSAKDATLVSHTHTASSSTSISDPGHLHTLRAAASGSEAAGFGLVLSASFENRPLVALGAGGGRISDTASTGISASTSTSIATAGSSATNANLPPYFALAYIIKL